jgi:hypothetical protein
MRAIAGSPWLHRPRGPALGPGFFWRFYEVPKSLRIICRIFWLRSRGIPQESIPGGQKSPPGESR